MFQFRRFPQYTYFKFQCIVPEYEPRWVSSFRDLRINAYLQLPEAYRSLSRLSSALSAKASTLRPYYFNRSRNDRISWFSVSSLMYSVTSAGFVFFSFSYLVINDEIWISLMSWLISISENEFYLNSCMKFSRYMLRTISFYHSRWAWVDSNHRPHAYQACALTGWAISPFAFPALLVYYNCLLYTSPSPRD